MENKINITEKKTKNLWKMILTKITKMILIFLINQILLKIQKIFSQKVLNFSKNKYKFHKMIRGK